VTSFIDDMIEFSQSERDRATLSDIKLSYNQYCNRAMRSNQTLKDKAFCDAFRKEVAGKCVEYSPGNIKTFKKLKIKPVVDEQDAAEVADMQSVAASTVPDSEFD